MNERVLKFIFLECLIYFSNTEAYNIDNQRPDDFESMLGKCCSVGSEWSNQQNTCDGYSLPVPGIPAEYQAMCLSTVSICCVRLSRLRNCKAGHDTARLGQDCRAIPSITGGEAHKDCCKSCKLGLLASSMKLPCSLSSMKFGEPWDNSFMTCCKYPTGDIVPDSKTDACESSECAQICIKDTDTTYRCSCHPGYKLTNDLVNCQDIDECLEGTHNCTLDNMDCVNVHGGYHCYKRDAAKLNKCPSGFTKNPTTLSCDDIDECKLNLHNCPPETQICINEIGFFRCESKVSEIRRCPLGYKFNSIQGKCIDIDECSERKDSCDTTIEMCVNKEGGYTCEFKIQKKCAPGFTFDPSLSTCIDINECKVNTKACNFGEFCFNTQGNFECYNTKVQGCPPGYKPSNVTICTDVNECEEQRYSCDDNTQVCQNEEGSYKCLDKVSCLAGFKPEKEGLNCIDVDECAEGIAACNSLNEACVNKNGSYTCEDGSSGNVPKIQCPTGYHLDLVNLNCTDINECQENENVCSDHENCINTLGSYKCVQKVNRNCELPMKFSEAFKRCVIPAKFVTTPQDRNVKEGELVKFECHFDGSPRPSINWFKNGSNQFPAIDEGRILFSNNRNVLYILRAQKSDVGSYSCEGYNGVEVAKATVNLRILDECQLGTHTCSATEECVSVDVGYECRPKQESNQPCKYGFERIGSQCIDINECQRGLHDCPNFERCDNTIGSFSCIRVIDCGTGYTWNTFNRRCEDNDECKLGTHHCGDGFKCENSQGSFRCEKQKCNKGYALSKDGMCEYVYCDLGFQSDESGTCVDIDECLSNPCESHEVCINTVGGYSCRSRLICGNGYAPNEYGTQCIDIDECAEKVDKCSEGQICVNNLGGYRCKCPLGHRLNRYRKCEDINECVRFSGKVCAANSDCENTVGSYKCKCKPGFRQLSDGRNCEDINECQTTENLCQHNCINTWGSYQCRCNRGYELSSDSRTCQDINECVKFKTRGKLCQGSCVNEPGSYKCSCPEGYRLSSDKYTCTDIDECKEQAICQGPNQSCLNTRGGYRCNTLDCPSNYVRDDVYRNRCKRASTICGENDRDCLNKPISYSYNYITFQSKMTIPVAGSLDLFTMQGPRWKGTTSRFELRFVASRLGLRQHRVSRSFFRLKNTASNRVAVSLLRPIIGPQEIELELILSMFYNGAYGGKAIAKIYLIVSEHEF